jgi:hypothetical protein
MICAMAVAGAWLFYASIDPDEAAAGTAPSTAESTQSPR